MAKYTVVRQFGVGGKVVNPAVMGAQGQELKAADVVTDDDLGDTAADFVRNGYVVPIIEAKSDDKKDDKKPSDDKKDPKDAKPD